ncbi:hypothetical protein JCM10212_003482 [Sporobolomyces blumeae]
MTDLPQPARLSLDDFDHEFGSLIELSSEALGGTIEGVSDEFFAKAECLLRVPPSVSMKGQFGPNGALFDGWESRRHNPNYDWVIVRLGATGVVHGVDIDTGHFTGNESPASGVWGAFVEPGQSISEDSSLWRPLLPITPLGPAQRHLFVLPSGPSPPVTHLKLTMHPDGGIGRFRAYGHVVPRATPPPSTTTERGLVDLAHVLNGGTVTGESDQHFGRGGNLVLPGRGKDMGDGWETRRSRGRLGTGKGDWVVIKLGEPGYLEWVDIDTLHFVGNFPASASLSAIVSDETDDPKWTRILDETRLGPHRQHFYQVSERDTAWTHVRLEIFPDGGVKRLRLYGRPTSKHPNGYSSLTSTSTFSPPLPIEGTSPVAASQSNLPNSTPTVANDSRHIDDAAAVPPRVPAVPLTPSAFAPYGTVVQAYPDPRSAPKEIPIKRVNFGTATKYNFLSPGAGPVPVPPRSSLGLEVNGSVGRGGGGGGGGGGGEGEAIEQKLNLCVFTSDVQDRIGDVRDRWQVRVLERHEFSSQSFVPMGGRGGGGGGARAREYLVVVALPGKDGQPDLSTLRAFVASSAQGITYHANIWHHPLIVLPPRTSISSIGQVTTTTLPRGGERERAGDEPIDFACIVWETGIARLDCEIWGDASNGPAVAVVERV